MDIRSIHPCAVSVRHVELEQALGGEYFEITYKHSVRGQVCIICHEPVPVSISPVLWAQLATDPLAEKSWTPEVEIIRKAMMERFADKLSMEEIAEFAYTLSPLVQAAAPPARLPPAPPAPPRSG
jgi:mono/diheme cytochrome c family protein